MATTRCGTCESLVDINLVICPGCGDPLRSQRVPYAHRGAPPVGGLVGTTARHRVGQADSTGAMAVSAPAGPRALWQVAALSVVTLGLYPIIWMGLTWSEMKRELGDGSMYPMWHALSMLVPVYSWFRLHNHYETINVLTYKVGWAQKVNAGAVVRTVMVTNIVAFVANQISPEVGAVAFVVSPLVYIGVILHGQSVLNSCWRARAQKVGLES